jgi:hypothetical protein
MIHRQLMSFQVPFERVIVRYDLGEGPDVCVCMIDELPDLTSDLIGAFFAWYVLLLAFFFSCYTAQYCTPTSILHLTQSKHKHDIGIGAPLYPSAQQLYVR